MHTPRPWKYRAAVQNNGPNYFAVITGEWGAPAIAECAQEANAEFITRACNAHSDLLEALAAVIDSFYCNNGLVGSITITEAEEAMRKARGG